MIRNRPVRTADPGRTFEARFRRKKPCHTTYGAGEPHFHLDHEHCLEVIVMRGRSDQLKEVTGRMLGTRGVIQGGAEYVAEHTLGFDPGRRMHQHDGQSAPSHAHSPIDSSTKPRLTKSRVEKGSPAVKQRAKRSPKRAPSATRSK